LAAVHGPLIPNVEPLVTAILVLPLPETCPVVVKIAGCDASAIASAAGIQGEVRAARRVGGVSIALAPRHIAVGHAGNAGLLSELLLGVYYLVSTAAAPVHAEIVVERPVYIEFGCLCRLAIDGVRRMNRRLERGIARHAIFEEDGAVALPGAVRCHIECGDEVRCGRCLVVRIRLRRPTGLRETSTCPACLDAVPEVLVTGIDGRIGADVRRQRNRDLASIWLRYWLLQDHRRRSDSLG